MGAYRVKEMVPKDFYGAGKYYNFEDVQLRGPVLYDSFLSMIYGDYMKLPPESDRKTHYNIIEINGKKVWVFKCIKIRRLNERIFKIV